MSIPVLALIQPPSMQLQEMNVEFGVEIVEPITEPIRSEVIPSTALGSSLAPSLALFTPLEQSNSTTIKVNMKIVREIPEGMARISDILTDLLSGIPQKAESVTKPTAPAIEEVHGIGKELGAMLRAKGILTTADFLKATEAPESRKEPAKSMKVSLKRIEGWREKAKILEEGKK